MTSVSFTENKLSFEARKEWQRKLKRQERAVADTEQRLAKLDTEISAIEARLATPEGMADIDLCMKHGTLKKDAETFDGIMGRADRHTGKNAKRGLCK